MLNKTTRSAITLGLPTVAAGLTAFMLLRAKKNWQFIAIATVIAFVGVWVVTAQVMKVAASAGPAPIPTGGGCDTYDPKALVDALYEDITCVFCTRNRDLYDKLLALSDCQLITVYNYWNKEYYSKVSQSLPVAIGDESNWADYFFEQQQQSLVGKFATLNLQ